VGDRSQPIGGPDVMQVAEKLLARPHGHTKTRPLVNLLGGEAHPFYFKIVVYIVLLSVRHWGEVSWEQSCF